MAARWRSITKLRNRLDNNPKILVEGSINRQSRQFDVTLLLVQVRRIRYGFIGPARQGGARGGAFITHAHSSAVSGGREMTEQKEVAIATAVAPGIGSSKPIEVRNNNTRIGDLPGRLGN